MNKEGGKGGGEEQKEKGRGTNIPQREGGGGWERLIFFFKARPNGTVVRTDQELHTISFF